jgi:hypothetical protein
MGSQAIQPSMVRAHSGPGCNERHNLHYVKLQAQDVVVRRQSGTRTPQSCHIWNSTPSPLPPRAYGTVPHETIFQKTMKGFTDAE